MTETILIFILGGQLPETWPATAAKNVAAESPNETDVRRWNSYPDPHTLVYCLWRIQVLMRQSKT